MAKGNTKALEQYRDTQAKAKADYFKATGLNPNKDSKTMLNKIWATESQMRKDKAINLMLDSKKDLLDEIADAMPSVKDSLKNVKAQITKRLKQFDNPVYEKGELILTAVNNSLIEKVKADRK